MSDNVNNISPYSQEFRLAHDPARKIESLENHIYQLTLALEKEQARVDRLVAAVCCLPGVCGAMGHLYVLPDMQVRGRIAAGLFTVPRECSRCGNEDGVWATHHWTLPDGDFA